MMLYDKVLIFHPNVAHPLISLEDGGELRFHLPLLLLRRRKLFLKTETSQRLLKVDARSVPLSMKQETPTLRKSVLDLGLVRS